MTSAGSVASRNLRCCIVPWITVGGQPHAFLQGRWNPLLCKGRYTPIDNTMSEKRLDASGKSSWEAVAHIVNVRTSGALDLEACPEPSYTPLYNTYNVRIAFEGPKDPATQLKEMLQMARSKLVDEQFAAVFDLGWMKIPSEAHSLLDTSFTASLSEGAEQIGAFPVIAIKEVDGGYVYTDNSSAEFVDIPESEVADIALVEPERGATTTEKYWTFLSRRIYRYPQEATVGAGRLGIKKQKMPIIKRISNVYDGAFTPEEIETWIATVAQCEGAGDDSASPELYQKVPKHPWVLKGKNFPSADVETK